MVILAFHIDISAHFVVCYKRGDDMENLFTKYIKDEDVTFMYAKGASGKTGKEFHTYHEIIYYMGGKAKFISENIHTTLKPNTLIIIPAETYHQLLITGPQEEYHRCVCHFLNIPEFKELISQSMNGALLLSMNKQLQFLFNQLITLTDQKCSDAVNSAILRSVLCLVLNEISINTHLREEATAPDTLSEKSVAYIAKHIADPITVTEIADELNVSVSHLAHAFKQQMNISIYQYILKKRLIMAHHKISSGVPATQAALECGFNDYSGFYKQFKKMFNKSPSDKGSFIV